MKRDMKDQDVNSAAMQIMEGKIPVVEVGSPGPDGDTERDDVLPNIEMMIDECVENAFKMEEQIKLIAPESKLLVSLSDSSQADAAKKFDALLRAAFGQAQNATEAIRKAQSFFKSKV